MPRKKKRKTCGPHRPKPAIHAAIASLVRSSLTRWRCPDAPPRSGLDDLRRDQRPAEQEAAERLDAVVLKVLADIPDEALDAKDVADELQPMSAQLIGAWAQNAILAMTHIGCRLIEELWRLEQATGRLTSPLI
jgi:hypothetical protein